MSRVRVLLLAALAVAGPAAAQDHARMDHSKMHAATTGPLPTLPGQDAFGAIGEVVRLLQADSSTDWSKVNLEALRLHLVDMSAVTLRARVRQVRVPAGLQMTVTGDAETESSIRRMTTSHGSVITPMGLTATSRLVPGGSLFTVTATDATNSALIAQIRALGFIGIMTLGNHHASHHIAIAKGM